MQQLETVFGKLKIEWIDSETLSEESANTDEYADGWARLKAADGILVPGGFGVRGLEGKIAAARYARRWASDLS